MIDQCPFCGAVKAIQEQTMSSNPTVNMADPTIACSSIIPMQVMDLSKYTVGNTCATQTAPIVWRPGQVR